VITLPSLPFFTFFTCLLSFFLLCHANLFYWNDITNYIIIVLFIDVNSGYDIKEIECGGKK